MPDRRLKLLALDGGGVRGLATLQILDQLMNAIDPTSPPKPCHYFDLIGGTSTGGLIAIMLGRLRMTVKECIETYTVFSDSIFQKRKHRFKLGMKLSSTQLQGRFDSDELERAIKDIIVQKGLKGSEQLEDSADAACKIFVCAQSKDTGEIVRLRSYTTPRAGRRDIKIWEAARATSAATTFFDPVRIGTGESFVDGAIGANNPVGQVWTEALDLWPSLQSSIKCLVSIGTGVPSLTPFVKDDLASIGKMLVRIATETEATAESFRRDKQDLDADGRYYRFNVSRGHENIALENSEARPTILAATRHYIETQTVYKELQACAKVLRLEAPSTDERENYMRCKNALYHADLLFRHDQIKSFASSGWLFEHTTFRRWSEADANPSPAKLLLTLKGNPGTGKSVLIKEAAQRAEKSNLIVLHHYFDRAKDSNSSTFKSALDKFCTSLLYQLLSKLEPKPWSFLQDWGELLRFKPGMLPWNLTQLQDAIREIIIGHEKRGNVGIRIFIDALDECYTDISDVRPTQPLEVLEWVSKLLQSVADAKVDVRVCLSRQHFPAYDGLEPKSQTILVEDHNRSGIEAFVKSELQRVEDMGLRQLLRHKIMSRCTNDFLWPTVVIQDVLAGIDSSTQKQVLQLVDELPRTHEEMYERLLFTGNGLKQDSTLHLLQIVSAARRPLTADQFRHALAFTREFEYESITEWEESNEGIEKGEKFENYLRQESRGLIEIHHGPDLGAAVDSVRFIHGSVSIFLRDPTSVLPEGASPWTRRCHLFLLELSLRALNLPGNESVAFAEYACENWIHHAGVCGELLQEIKELPSFLGDCSKRKAKRIIERQILALNQANARQSHLLEDKEGLLVLLATMGCNTLLQRHLTDCESCQQDCAMYSPRYRRALQNTIIGRFTNTTIWLLEKHVDADININMLYENRTLLYKACYFGQKEVVAFLLAKDADPLKRSPMGYEYPLHAAIELGQEDIVRLLLQHPSASEQFKLRRAAQKAKGYTPLHTAINSRQPVRQKLAVLRLLLKNAPKGVGTLDLEDDKGVSVLALARQIGEDGGSGAQDVEDEVEDFFEDERDRGS